MPFTTRLLVGAPPYATCADETGLTVRGFLPAFTQYLDLKDARVAPAASPYARSITPAWRVLRAQSEHLPTGLSQRAWLHHSFGNDRNVYSENPLASVGRRGHEDEQSYRRYDEEEEEDLQDEAEGETTFFSLTDAPLADKMDVSDELISTSYALHEAASCGKSHVNAKAKMKERRRSISSRTSSDSSGSSSAFPSLSPWSLGSSPSPSPFQSQSQSPTKQARTRASKRARPTAHPPDSSQPQPPPQHAPRAPLTAPHLTSLAALPSASHILRINPETITIDLIAAVISVSPPLVKTVRARQGHGNNNTRLAALVEVCLGDETRAGFCVAFWMDATAAEKAMGGGVDDRGEGKKRGDCDARDGAGVRGTLVKLRCGDVVLMKNVALTQYMGKVQGHNLGGGGGGGGGGAGDHGKAGAGRSRTRRWGRGNQAPETGVALVYRRGAVKRARERGVGMRIGGAVEGEDEVTYDSDEFDGYDEAQGRSGNGGTAMERSEAEKVIFDKIGRVREWALKFTGGGGGGGVKRKLSIEELRGGRRGGGARGGPFGKRAKIPGRMMELPPDETPVR